MKLQAPCQRGKAACQRDAAAEREATLEAKILAVVRSRLQEVRRSKMTGKLVVEINFNKGGPTTTYTEIGTTYKILEE